MQTRSRLAPDPSDRARLNRAHDEVTASLLCLTPRVRSAFPGKLKVELHSLAGRVLERWMPGWREKYRSRYEVFEAADGEQGTRPVAEGGS